MHSIFWFAYIFLFMVIKNHIELISPIQMRLDRMPALTCCIKIDNVKHRAIFRHAPY